MNLQRIKLTFVFVSLAELVNKLVPLLLIRLGQTRLGTEGLGHAQFAIYIVELFLPFLSWGFELYGPVSLSGVSKGSNEWQARIGRIVGTRIVLGVIVYGALIASLFTVDKFIPYRSITLGVAFLMFLSSVSVSFVHTADQSLSVLARITIGAKILSLIAVALLVHRPDDAWIFAILSYGVNIVIAIGSLVFVLRRYGVIRPKFDQIIETLKLSFPFAITFILATMVDRIELWFAESWGGATTVGALSAPLRMYQGLLFMIIALSAIFYSEGLAFPEKIGRFLRLTIWLLSVFILPLMVGVFFVGEPLLVAFSGEGFSGQGINLAYICTGMFGHSLLLVAGAQSLNSLGKVKWTNWAYISAFIIGVSGSSLLIRMDQTSLALLAPAFGKTLAGLALFYLACRETQGFTSFQLPLKGISFGVLAMLGFLWYSPNLFWIWRLFVGAAIYGVIFLGFSYPTLAKILKKEAQI